MTPHERLSGYDPVSPEFDEKLTAYLDGELDADASRALEDLIAENAEVRRRVQELDRAWNMLESLKPAGVGESFTRTTVEMVQMENGVSLPRRRTWFHRYLAYLSVVSVCFLLGFGVASGYFSRQENLLLRDLPVVERLDAYLHVETMEFLRALREEGLFDEEVPHEAP